MRRPFQGYLFALLATMLWSGNFIVARGLAQDIPPVHLALLRWLTAALALAPFGLRPLWIERRTVLRHPGYFALVGLIGVAVFNTVIYYAARYTAALNLSLIATFTPVAVLLLSRLVLGEPLTLRRCLGALCAIAGVVTLITRGRYAALLHLDFNAGDLLMLLATLLFASYTILVRLQPPGLGPRAFLMATFLLGAALLLPWAILEWRSLAAVQWTPRMAGAILYIGVCASLLAYLFWNRAIELIGPALSGLIYYSLPLFCAAEAVLLLDETVGWIHAISGALVVGGIAYASRRG